MKRVIAIFTAILLFVSLFAACGQKTETTAVGETKTGEVKNEASVNETSAKEPEVKKLEGKIVFATNMTDKADNVLTDLAKEFMKLNPGVTVEVEGLKDIKQILQTRMAANELPDVTPILKTVLPKDYPLYFAPIDDLGFTKDNIYFYDYGLGADGKQYALNVGVSYDAITYNKKAFKDAGIEKVPTTIEEFYTVCEKLKAKGIIPLGTSFKDAWPLNWFATDYAFAFANTGDTNYRNSMKDKDELFSDDGGTLAGFKLLRDLNKKGYLEPDLMSANWDGCRRDHAQGKTGMFFLGTWYPPQLVAEGARSEDIGMFPFPGTKALPQRGDWLFGIAKSSKNPDTAKAFLKWLWDESRYSKAIGIISPLKNAKAEDPQVAELLSFNMPLATAITIDPVFTEISNKSEINLTSVLQEYILSDNPDSVVKKYNDKWAKTRKDLGK